MNRQQKQVFINEFKDLLNASQAAFLVNYQGLCVSSLQELRKSLREDGGSLRITKATLMRIAAKDIAGTDSFAEEFKDQVGLIFASQDPCSVAKKIKAFADKNEALKIISGFYESKTLTKQEVEFLASIPPRIVLLAQVVGTIQAPIAQFARLIQAIKTKRETEQGLGSEKAETA